jgi:DNA invertase Pin-like site-specific DNA recombinase
VKPIADYLDNSPQFAVAYTRVSTTEQADSGLGLSAQRAAIEAEVDRRAWSLTTVYTDAGASGRSLANRPALADALDVLRRGEAQTLVVAKLDRLSRSLLDFAGLMQRAQREGWALVALDLGVDTTTPTGRLVASVMASVAEWERETIGQRTKDALAAKRAQGVRLGRPRSLDDGTATRIRELRENGLTYQRIADSLTEEGVPTARGGSRWYPSTVSQALASRSN